MTKIYMVINSLESEKGRGLPINPIWHQSLYEKVHGFPLFYSVGFADSFEDAQLYFRKQDFGTTALFQYEREVIDNIKEAIIECEVDGENVVALLEMHKLILKREGTSHGFFKQEPLQFEKLKITEKDFTSGALSEINRQYQNIKTAKKKPT